MFDMCIELTYLLTYLMTYEKKF